VDPGPTEGAPLDGNAGAGELGELFAFDVTAAVSTCATCHHPHRVAELKAYLQTAGLVLRCASCSAVQVRVVRSATRAWLDLSGVSVLEILTA
jgi:hypothetical protein